MITPIEVALSQWGIKGVTGVLHNPVILKYFRSIKATWVKDDETAWCAAFVNWCLKEANYPYSAKLNARSFLTYGGSTKTPKVGDIVVFWRIAKAGAFGHVGFFVKEEDGLIYCLGGNQSNQVNITAFSKGQVLGYRTLPVLPPVVI